MKSFNSDRKSSRRDSGRFERREPRFSNQSGRGSPDRFKRGGSGFKKEMHEVICDRCGEKCEVPFRPTSSKPVYCSDCFRKNEHTDSRRSDAPVRDNSRLELDQINRKLDKILSLLEGSLEEMEEDDDEVEEDQN